MRKNSGMVVDDGDVAIKIWSLKPLEQVSLAIAANGDFSGCTGGVGGTADSTLTIDVSDDGYNTFGKVVDRLNSLLDSDGEQRFRAVLVDALREDSSNDTLLQMAEAAITSAGMSLYKDTSVALNLSRCIANIGRDADDIGVRNQLFQMRGTNTYGSGTNLFQIYRCFDKDVTKTSELIFQTAGGATTVEATYPTYQELQGMYAQNARLLCRMIGSAACTGSFMVDGVSKAIPAEG